MKKLLLVLAAMAAALMLTASVITYPAVGGALYNGSMALESRLYGFHKAQVDVGDATLMTYQGGPAKAERALVMIHGYSADKDVWLRFARHFTDDFRVVIVDLPGHGETAFNPALQYDARSQAERVLRLMDALNIAQADLVGNSMGGFIAARLSHDHPERVRSAVLMDAAGVTSPLPSEMGQLLAQGKNPFLIETRDQFRSFYAMTMEKAPWVPGASLDYIADRYIAQRAALARIFSDFHNKDLLDTQLADIRTPTLVMWGAKDRLVHVAAASVWHEGIKGSQLIIYPDLGHMPMVEDPARSAHDIKRFIESTK